MKATYKLALAAAATLLLIVIASLILRSSPTDSPTDSGSTDGQQPPADDSPSQDQWSADPPANPPSRDQAQDAGANAGPNRIRYDDSAMQPLPEPEPDPVPTLNVGRNPFGEDRSIFGEDDDFAPRPLPGTPSVDRSAEFTPPAPADEGDVIPSDTEIADRGQPAEANEAMAVEDSPAPAPTSSGTALGPTDRVDTERGTPAANTATSVPTGPAILRRYTIESGDSLSSIALAVYNDADRWVEIAQANPTIDPNRLRVGQEIKLPDLAGQGAPAAIATETSVPRRGASYTVKAGDSLSGIAKQYYDSASKWELIYQANRSTIGSNPGNLKVGMELLIPPPANGAN